MAKIISSNFSVAWTKWCRVLIVHRAFYPKFRYIASEITKISETTHLQTRWIRLPSSNKCTVGGRKCSNAVSDTLPCAFANTMWSTTDKKCDRCFRSVPTRGRYIHVKLICILKFLVSMRARSSRRREGENRAHCGGRETCCGHIDRRRVFTHFV